MHVSLGLLAHLAAASGPPWGSWRGYRGQRGQALGVGVGNLGQVLKGWDNCFFLQ